MFVFSWSSVVTPTPYAYPNLLNKKTLNLSECKYHIVYVTLLVFVDAGENLVMADNVAMPSNPPISLIEKEEFEEAPLDVNVSQWLPEKEPSKRMMHTRVDRSAWDCQLSPNPHALVIYLEFVPACGVAPERFEKCQCEDHDVHLHCRTWVLGDGHYHWLWGPINPFSMEHWAEYLTCTICRVLEFLQLWSIPLKLYTKL